jgi:flagellar biosynthesis protein FlhF
MSLASGTIQTIQGATLAECKRKLQEMYGDDFEIKNRESVFKSCGIFGLKQKEVQVVSYVVNHKKAYDNSSYSDYSRESEEEKLEKNRQAILQAQNATLVNSALSSLATKMDEMNKQINSINSTIVSSSGEMHETIKRIEELLEQNEFTMSYIRMIEEKIRAQFSLDELDDFNLVERYVVDWIGESIQISQEKPFRPPHVVIIIGPTGVGKTTTLAKLAANTILDAKAKNIPRPKLCIFTIDSMRVGALEQLERYGEAMDQKVLKAETAEDVKEIYEEYKDHTDYIFVDTGGYSPNDATHIGMMKNVLDVNMNPDVYLSVSASTKASDLQTIFRNYEPLGYESVIVTKCDESKQIGNIISVLWDRRKTISYITDGQRVPRNIRKASIVDILLNLTGFNIDRVHIENKFGEQ